MASVIVAGGGLAGLAAAAALADAGHRIQIFESKPFLGGRATSYALPRGDGSFEFLDNCQHVLLRCCVNLLDFYRRLGVSDKIEFHRTFYFVEPGGRVSKFESGIFPKPLQFLESFTRLRYLSLREKLALCRGLLDLQRDRTRRKDLDQISMQRWLEERRQPERVVERFWRQVLVSAVNEELDRMAAIHGFQVLWLGFLASGDGYEMGIPAVPLGNLYAEERWSRWPNVRLHLRTPVERLDQEGLVAGGSRYEADAYVIAMPFERLSGVQDLVRAPAMEHSPITGVHLWFDRDVTDLPHATLMDRTIQWMFNKGNGHVQLVVSASRSLVEKPRQEIIALAVRELGEFFPSVRSASLERAHVVKEVRATFSACPGLTLERRGAQCEIHNWFLAGDWTRSGWPATMEGAVRSGYIAAEAVCSFFSDRRHFLLPDIA
jgi:zeta-carotene desaturase